jgi:hypothetical protein
MSISATRRDFLLGCAGATVVSSGLFSGSLPTNSEAGSAVTQSTEDKELAWHDPQSWGIEGRGFDDPALYYDRLPARAESAVRPPVWDLSRCSAGMSVRFQTNSKSIHVKYELTKQALAMPHMPATSVSGVDLYAQDEGGAWRWASVLKPTQMQIEATLINGLIPSSNGPREFMMYLPLYNGVTGLAIGVENGATFNPVAPRSDKPIVFYGTSIMHGACASRSGMAIPALVGRRLNRPTINLGFSGNGRMEQAVGEFLCELDPCAYAVDCLPNMSARDVADHCQPLVLQLRAARPDTPVLLVEDRINTNAWIRGGAEAVHAAKRAALKRAFDELVAGGVTRLHYVEGSTLLGDDGEAATDGSHPSDLGMLRYADAYETALRRIL